MRVVVVKSPSNPALVGKLGTVTSTSLPVARTAADGGGVELQPIIRVVLDDGGWIETGDASCFEEAKS